MAQETKPQEAEQQPQPKSPDATQSQTLTLEQQCERDVEMLTGEIVGNLKERDKHIQIANQLDAAIKNQAALRRSKIDTLLASKPGYVDPDKQPANQAGPKPGVPAPKSVDKVIQRSLQKSLRRGRG